MGHVVALVALAPLTMTKIQDLRNRGEGGGILEDASDQRIFMLLSYFTP